MSFSDVFLSDYSDFLKIYILQGSVATQSEVWWDI